MRENSNYQMLLELARNRDLGSSALLHRFMQAIPGLTSDELSRGFHLMKRNFPLMAVWSFAEDYFNTNPPTGQNIQAFVNLVNEAGKKVLANAMRRLDDFQSFLTISRSSLVESFFCIAGKQRDIRVTCGVGLPANEGRALILSLERKGISATCVDDWELDDQVESVDAILTGADWISNTRFINKIGTASLVQRAGETGKPVFILAEGFKKAAPFPVKEDLMFQEWPQGSRQRHVKVFESIPLAGVEIIGD